MLDVSLTRPIAIDTEQAEERPGVWRALLRSVDGRVGLALGGLMLAFIIIGPHVAPYSPTAIGVGDPQMGPSSQHLLGTDSLGRDVLSRLLCGGRTILFIPLVAVTLAYLVGGALGLLSAYVRGWPDFVISRTMDFMMTLPPLLLTLVLISGLGTSKVILATTIAIVWVPRVGRVIRGAAQGVVTSDYVLAAEARGERTLWIMGREIVPNIAGPALADYTLRLVGGIILVASLNFLGLGAQPPSPDWGLMVNESRASLSVTPLAVLAPAAAIALLSVGLVLIGEVLTRHLTREVVEMQTA